MNFSLVLQTSKLWGLTKTPLINAKHKNLSWFEFMLRLCFSCCCREISWCLCSISLFVSINPSLNWWPLTCFHLWQHFCWSTNFHFEYFSQKSSTSSACYYVFFVRHEKNFGLELCNLKFLIALKKIINMRMTESFWILKLLRPFHEFCLETTSWNAPQ